MLALLLTLSLCQAEAAVQPSAGLTHGPFRGPADTQSVMVWARASRPGHHWLHLVPALGGAEPLSPVGAAADAEGDLTLQFHATGLVAATAYDWWITRGDEVVHPRGGAPLCTAMADASGAATIAFGSCAEERRFPEQPIWGQLLARGCNALVLLGDTPYIDDGRRERRRQRYREFYGAPGVRAALSAVPFYATWDDHDYAANDQFGDVPAAATARQVFTEYHAQARFGDGERGIYTRFRRGPVEVFLLDARSFADRAESPLAAGARSLLGADQLAWLQRGLLASTARFKVLACGLVWNGAVRPGKQDCWGRWQAERDGLLRWLGEQAVEGVVLVSGDVHRARLVVHPWSELVGYDVPEFVSSPLAQNPLDSNDVDLPGLRFDAGEPEVVLLLSADVFDRDDARLVARFVAGDGRELHRFETTTRELRRR